MRVSTGTSEVNNSTDPHNGSSQKGLMPFSPYFRNKLEFYSYIYMFRIQRHAPRSKLMKLLTKVEEFILLAVWSLQENAYSLSIQKHISEISDEKWSLGTIYAPLERLEKRGYIHSHITEPKPEKGGRQKRIYKITEAGKKALIQSRNVHKSMWEQIPAITLKQ
jgi:PadR family transcriptional regulator PadR